MLDRIRGLAIPPAWQDVWICPWPNGHIQATGVDAAGRRQYRYHDAWRARRDAEKHERVLEIARELPDVRDAVKAGLRTRGLNRDRVLATAIRLLDLGAFRIGSEQYEEENGTYGLATLKRTTCRCAASGRSSPTRPRAARARGRDHRPADGHRRPAAAGAAGGRGGPAGLPDRGRRVARRDQRRDQRLPQGDQRRGDHRQGLPHLDGDRAHGRRARRGAAPASKTARKKVISAAYKQVSEQLGNTPAVCKASYVDPRGRPLRERRDRRARAARPTRPRRTGTRRRCSEPPSARAAVGLTPARTTKPRRDPAGPSSCARSSRRRSAGGAVRDREEVDQAGHLEGTGDRAGAGDQPQADLAGAGGLLRLDEHGEPAEPGTGRRRGR